MNVGSITLDFKSNRYCTTPPDGAELLVIRCVPGAAGGLRLEYAQYTEENPWHDARFIRRRRWGACDNSGDPYCDDHTRIPDEEIVGWAVLPHLSVGAQP
jgi:hypothetical protein